MDLSTYLEQDSEQMRKPLDRMSTSVSVGPGVINIAVQIRGKV